MQQLQNQSSKPNHPNHPNHPHPRHLTTPLIHHLTTPLIHHHRLIIMTSRHLPLLCRWSGDDKQLFPSSQATIVAKHASNSTSRLLSTIFLFPSPFQSTETTTTVKVNKPPPPWTIWSFLSIMNLITSTRTLPASPTPKKIANNY